MQYTSAILALAAGVSAHVTLQKPVPYNTPVKDPLDPSGSNFPCQATGTGYYTGTANEYNAGDKIHVEFGTGDTAVHGGGSCQFSLTTDTAPTKDTQWKVIHTAEGGCPAAAAGNLVAGDSSAGVLATYDVQLPEDLPSGEYSFAWTWFNKIGNREMYMNCAPLSIGGGSNATAASADVSSVLGKLPDMFVANLPPQECTTVESTDVVFPDPGDSVEKGSTFASGTVSGSGCASMTKLGAGSGSMGSPSGATGAPAASSAAGGSDTATSAVASSAPAATSAPAQASNSGGIFAPGASSAVATGGATSTAAAPAASSTAGNSTPASGDCNACSTNGAVVCIGTAQFGLCNAGCAVAQDLAAGTTCSNGVISRRSVRRFPRAHLHRRHGSEMI